MCLLAPMRIFQVWYMYWQTGSHLCSFWVRQSTASCGRPLRRGSRNTAVSRRAKPHASYAFFTRSIVSAFVMSEGEQSPRAMLLGPGRVKVKL